MIRPLAWLFFIAREGDMGVGCLTGAPGVMGPVAGPGRCMLSWRVCRVQVSMCLVLWHHHCARLLQSLSLTLVFLLGTSTIQGSPASGSTVHFSAESFPVWVTLLYTVAVQFKYSIWPLHQHIFKRQLEQSPRRPPFLMQVTHTVSAACLSSQDISQWSSRPCQRVPAIIYASLYTRYAVWQTGYSAHSCTYVL